MLERGNFPMPNEQSAHTILSVLRNLALDISKPFPMESLLIAEFLERLDEAEMIAGMLYARRNGWLIIEGNEIRVTAAGLQQMQTPPRKQTASEGPGLGEE